MKYPTKDSILAFFKRQWLGSIAIALLLVMVFGNTAGNLKSGSSYSPFDGDYGYEEFAMMEADYDDYVQSEGITMSASRDVASSSVVAPAETIESKIIKTGSLSLHVDDVRESVDSIDALVSSWGGSVLNSSVNRGSYSYSAYLDVRVPSDQFESAVDALKELSLYVSYEYTNAEDVTETYIDLTARLNNMEEEEAQYLAILDEAGTMTEILEVTRAISDVRYEIESVQSTLSYYDTRVAFSTISIDLSEDESVTTVTDQWRPGSTWSEAMSDWVDWLQDRVDDGIYLFVFGWPLLILAVIILVISRIRRRRK